MNMYEIPVPKGITRKSLIEDENYCFELDNFVIDNGMMVLRQGCKKIHEDKEIKLIHQHVYLNALMLIQERGEVFLLKDEGKVSEKAGSLELMTKYISKLFEFNDFLYVFLKDGTTKLFHYSDGQYRKVTADTSDDRGEYKATGVVAYKNRLWFYNEGSGVLQYTEPLAIKGKVNEYNVSHIFNPKGKLTTVFEMGFDSSSGIDSYLVAAFDSGDLLFFKGLDPNDVHNWSVLAKISLNTKVFPEYVKVNSTVYLKTAKGLVDVGIALQSQGDLREALVTRDLTEQYVGKIDSMDWQNTFLTVFGKFLLITSYEKGLSSYLFNIWEQSFSTITGWDIRQTASMYDVLYFLDDKGAIFQAFTGGTDDGKEIRGLFFSNNFSFGNLKNKRIDNVTVQVKMNGNFKVFVDLDTHYESVNYRTEVGGLMVNKGILWNKLSGLNWENISAKVWNKMLNSNLHSTNIRRRKTGNMFNVKYMVVGNNDTSSDFMILRTQLKGNE